MAKMYSDNVTSMCPFCDEFLGFVPAYDAFTYEKMQSNINCKQSLNSDDNLIINY